MTTAGNLASRSSAGFALDKFSSSITWLQGVGTLVRRIDRVVLSLVTLMVVLAIIDAQVAWRTLGYVTSELAHLGPWFTLSVFFAAAAKATGGDAIVARAFAGREGRMIPLAAIVGGLTPFCSCGVIPLVAGLFGAGVPLAPVMAFWIASPLMDPTQFFRDCRHSGRRLRNRQGGSGYRYGLARRLWHDVAYTRRVSLDRECIADHGGTQTLLASHHRSRARSQSQSGGFGRRPSARRSF